MPSLVLSLLGSPRIERDGQPIAVDTRKAIALLAYLATTNQHHSRDTLAALLWPDYDQAHARATLRRTLSTLHKALGGAWLNIGRDHIALQRGAGMRIDVDEFEERLRQCRSHGHAPADVCPACLKPLSEAAALYRDDFLAGFSVRDSPSFEDWQFFQSQGMRRELAGALERLTQGYAAQVDYATAIIHARRWLSLDRLHEPAHRHLMQLYVWAGQRAAALHQYRECVQVLDRELGVAPLEETTQLYEAIKENRAPPPPEGWPSGASATQPAAASAGDERAEPAPSSAASGERGAHPVAAYPLVGRSVEWEMLMSAYAAAKNAGHLIILEGEAGIGKTRLAEDFVAHTQRRGASAFTTRCYEGETDLAYGPVISGLRAALAQPDAAERLRSVPEHWLSEGERLLPELAAMVAHMPDAPPLDRPGAQSRFFEGLRRILLAICAGPLPGIVFFDDIHWADGASLDLLAYLVRRLPDHPLCLLLTWRSELAPSDVRLRRAVTEAQHANGATVITLARLSHPQVRELVRSAHVASPALPGDLDERLYSETEGVPFFVMAYLAALAQGALPAADGGWSLPGGARDLLHSRLDVVSATGRQLLSAAAVIGRSFDFDTLREVSGRSEEETVAGLEEVMAQGLVAEAPSASARQGPVYDFSHDKLRALVHDETSLARRRLVHRRVAETLEARARGHREAGALAGTIAHHYLNAGDEPAAAEYFRLAGEHAWRLYANAEALAHINMALALGHPDSAGLHEALGDVHARMGGYAEALASYEAAAALSDAEKLATIEHKLAAIYIRRGEWDRAESHLAAAVEALGDLDASGARSRIFADWSLAAHRSGQSERAVELASRALRLAESAHDARALVAAHNILGILANSQGDRGGAQQHLRESLALAEEVNDPEARAAALNNLALVYGASGEIDLAIASAEAALALCVSLGDRHRQAALHNNLADLHHAAGRSEAAKAHVMRSVTIYTEIGMEAGAIQPEIWKLAEW